MKLFVVTISVILGFAITAESAVWRGVANDINNPGKCLINKVLIDYGKDYHPSDRCEKISCYEGGEVAGFSCGIKIVDGCKDAGYVDVARPYPDCCLKKYICKENGKERIVEL